jgi:hypothetical protein
MGSPHTSPGGVAPGEHTENTEFHSSFLCVLRGEELPSTVLRHSQS